MADKKPGHVHVKKSETQRRHDDNEQDRARRAKSGDSGRVAQLKSGSGKK